MTYEPNIMAMWFFSVLLHIYGFLGRHSAHDAPTAV